MSIVIDGVPVRWPEQAESIRAAPELGPSGPARSDESRSPSSFERALQGLAGAIEQGERIVDGAATRYSSLEPAELIALQAGIYRYSEAVDLTAKLVDRTTSAVRTVLQGGH
jgi:hypothetical protein